MTSPKVIVKCKFDLALNNPDRGIYVSKSNYKKNIKGMFNYFSDIKKRAVNMFDYFEGKINQDGNVNLVIESGEYATDKEVEIRKMEYVNYIEKSNLWKGVVSFDDREYIDSSIEIPELEKKIVKDIFPRFFRYCGFKDPNKMSYQIAFHSNTDHYHFHFSFIEKEANYIQSNGEVGYRRKGVISNKELDYLKNEILHAIDRHREFTPLVKNTNEKIDELKKYFKPSERNYALRNIDDLLLEENLLRLGKLLSDYRKDKEGRIKYNSIYNKEIKKLTKSIKDYLFNNKRSELYMKDSEFRESLDKINEYFYSIQKDNHINKKNFKSEYSKTKQEYVDNYIYNAIVNHAFNKFSYYKKTNKGISDDEVLQEAILKLYKKNKKLSKYDILVNYLSNKNKNDKYKSKYKIEQSIKKINEEMEEAVSEFSKLFQSNEYSSG